MQGAEVLGPVPAPFLAPAKPKHLPPAVAPVAAMPDTPLSFLIKASPTSQSRPARPPTPTAPAGASCSSSLRSQEQRCRPTRTRQRSSRWTQI